MDPTSHARKPNKRVKTHYTRPKLAIQNPFLEFKSNIFFNENT
jgi:hypothetical protein